MIVIKVSDDHVETLLLWQNGPHRLTPVSTPQGHIVGISTLANPAYEELWQQLDSYEKIDYEPIEED